MKRSVGKSGALHDFIIARMGEDMANMIICRGMAIRPKFKPPDKAMTPAELKQFRERLATLTWHHVSIEYQSAYMECRMYGSGLPPPAAVQKLVQIYKQLWRWKERQ